MAELLQNIFEIIDKYKSIVRLHVLLEVQEAKAHYFSGAVVDCESKEHVGDAHYGKTTGNIGGKKTKGIELNKI
jgi:hypothetical protein